MNFVWPLLAGLVVLNCVDCARRVCAHSRARRSVDEAFQKDPHRLKRDTDLHIRNVRDLMKASEHEDFHPVDRIKTNQGNILWKFREDYKGLEILDASLAVETDSTGHYTGDAQGTFIEGIEDDVHTLQPLVTEAEALFLCMREFSIIKYRAQVNTPTMNLKITLDKHNIATLVYFVQFLIENEETRIRPTCLIEGMTGQIFNSWDSLETKSMLVEGYGGNIKTGAIRYGEGYRHLAAKQIGEMCYLENEFVKVVNMNYTYDDDITDAISFPCDSVYNDTYDNSYSPGLDAFYNGMGVYNMFKDWFNMEPFNLPIVLRIHYGESLESAFWNGANVSIGDGDERFYALTAMDVMAHELAHSFTERHSGLYYFNQPGSIDESFSDITGEVAEAYLYGNDWNVGSEIMRKVTAFRYFNDPSLDGLSISHVDNYTDGINVHFGSGVMNKVFYEIVHELDMSVRDAYSLFLLSNRLYWGHFTTYEEAGCDLMKAAYDLGFDPNRIKKALKVVGLKGCDVSKHVLTLRRNFVQKGFFVSGTRTPMFGVNSPSWTLNLTVQANSKMGELKIFATDDDLPNPENFKWESTWNGTTSTLFIEEPPTGLVYIMVTSPAKLDIEDGTLVVSYVCGDGDWMDGAFFLDCLMDDFR